MTKLTAIVTFITEIGILLGFIVGFVAWIKKLTEGMKCQLRSEMLRIYYHNIENKKIRQYELENFIYLYKAYKALKGNSFIDRIYEEVKKWKIVT